MLWPLGWLLWLNILSRYLLQLFPGDIWQLALTFCILSYICNLCRKYFKEKLSKFQKNLTLNLVKKWNLSHFQTNTIKLAEGRHPTVTLCYKSVLNNFQLTRCPKKSYTLFGFLIQINSKSSIINIFHGKLFSGTNFVDLCA